MRQVITEIMRKYVEELVEEGFNSGALDVRTVAREKMDDMDIGGMVEEGFKEMVEEHVVDTAEDVIMEVLDDANLW